MVERLLTFWRLGRPYRIVAGIGLIVLGTLLLIHGASGY